MSPNIENKMGVMLMGHPTRSQCQDEKMWCGECTMAKMYILTSSFYFCSKCKGCKHQISLKTFKVHLFQNGQYPMFLIWKAPSDQYELDDKWVVATYNCTFD